VVFGLGGNGQSQIASSHLLCNVFGVGRLAAEFAQQVANDPKRERQRQGHKEQGGCQIDQELLVRHRSATLRRFQNVARQALLNLTNGINALGRLVKPGLTGHTILTRGIFVHHQLAHGAYRFGIRLPGNGFKRLGLRLGGVGLEHLKVGVLLVQPRQKSLHLGHADDVRHKNTG